MPKEPGKYQANHNGGQNNNQSSDSSKKAAKVAAKGAANYFTGGKGGAVVDKLADTKAGNEILDKAGKIIDNNPRLRKLAKQLDDTGVADKADKAMDMVGSSKAGNTPKVGEDLATKKSPPPGASIGDNFLSNKKNSKSSDILEEDEEELGGESFSSSVLNGKNKKGSFDVPITVKMFIISHWPIILGIVFFTLILFSMSYTVLTVLEDEESLGGNCQYTQNPDESSKKEARYTTYTGTSLGGSLGNISQYIKEGTIFYENGLAMWKGGSKSKLNGKVYGESGKNYMIVATATNYLVGNCATSGCGYKWQNNNKINYFEYGDTFTIALSFDGNKTYKNYDAIVLDSCGACMEWSLTYPKSGLYAPKKNMEIERCTRSEGYKIDIYRRDNNVKIPADMGYIMGGSSSNICVGQVDLGTLVLGIDDTKLLQGPTISSLYSGNIDGLNNLIQQNVDKYGRGTGNGVAAAAITLINSLKEKGYRIPYYWAGGHADAISGLGVNPDFGKSTSKSCSRTTCYSYKGFDCSGFVSWAVKNGACPSFAPHLAADFMSLGPHESAKQAKPGDIQASTGHVRLVVQNNDGKLILAESSGGTGGVHFSTYNPNERGYVLVDMSKYYASGKCK